MGTDDGRSIQWQTMDPHDQPAEPAGQNAAFVTTHWSLVVSAGQRSSPDAESALATLCQTYWYPLYAFSRRRGYSADNAADLTQEFIARLLEKEFLKSADRTRGRFRTFLLTLFTRFLSNEGERQNAQKRGGGKYRLSIDMQEGEDCYRFEPVDNWTPEALYERRWALTLLDQVMERLGLEYANKGKSRLFEHCKALLAGSDQSAFRAEMLRELQMSDVALRVAVHRMRERFRAMLRDEVAQTVEGSDDVHDELEYLKAAIRGKKL
jgi:DNA-directed RNA polymerase specialized sigma24 family protein